MYTGPRSGYRYDGYAADLAIGFGNARARAHGEEAALVQALQVTLILSTITSLAGSLDPGVVAEAVKRSLWPVAKAIGMVRSLTSQLDRLELCWALLRLVNLADVERDELRELLDSARPRKHHDKREFWLRMRKTRDNVRGCWASPSDHGPAEG
jgi:hypothetical protein